MKRRYEEINPELAQDVIDLYINGYSFEQLGREFNVSTSTIRKMIHRIRPEIIRTHSWETLKK